MRFATLDLGGRDRVAVVAPDGAHYCLASDLIDGFDGDLVDLIATYPQGVHDATVRGWTPLPAGILRAPIPMPRKNVFCVGKNYHAHAKEFAQSGFDQSSTKEEAAPPEPVIFTKPWTTVIGDGADVLAFDAVTRQLDYEAELAVVIGTGGRGIRREDAFAHVWGYTIVNDVTARDLQQLHRQWFVGKSLDTFCPMGPWVVSADEVDATDLRVRCWINGELRQDASTRDLIFDIPKIIETLSAGMTLSPGDIISTGTPAGVGIGFQPPRFLKSGDVMQLSIDGIGTLINRVA